MLMDAFVLSLVTTGGFMMIYKKLPYKVRKHIEKHDLAADACALFLTYLLLGGTLTALTAGAITGLLTSAALHVANNPDKYQHLIAAKEIIGDTLGKVSDQMNSWGKSFMASRKKPQLNVAYAA